MSERAARALDEDEGKVSQSSEAFRRIRTDILCARYAPGERLKINVLVEDLGVSPGAVREALSRLAPEGLVVVGDFKGFSVAPVSADDLIELTELRCEVEGLAGRLAVERGTEDWREGLVAKAFRLRETPKIGEDGVVNLEWHTRHFAFHMAIFSACGNQRLLNLVQNLWDQADRYRWMAIADEKNRNVPAEHERILKAALNRDAERLEQELRAHIKRTADIILKRI